MAAHWYMELQTAEAAVSGSNPVMILMQLQDHCVRMKKSVDYPSGKKPKKVLDLHGIKNNY